MINSQKTVLQCIKDYSIQSPNKLAVISPSKELTYEQYWEDICRVAHYLQSIGVKKNEYIIIKSSQTVEYLVLCHATQLAGAIPVPLEKSVNEGRVLEILQETGSNKFFGDITVEGYITHNVPGDFESANFADELKIPCGDDVSMVLFTTGTTGKSKGIVISYNAEFAVAENVMYGVQMKKDNVEIIPMPMNHSFSLRRYFANMINGSTVIVIDGVFFVKILFDMMERYSATSLAMAPAAIGIIFKLTKDKIADYASQLDYIQFGAAPIAEVDKEHLRRILPNIRLYNIYGSTEFGCATVLNFNSQDNLPSCIGYPTKNSVFLIVDEDGNEISGASSQNPGYLCYSGSMGMQGYFNDPNLTNQTINNGYMKSSDLGYVDSAGRLFMLGRADDVIITGGNKVSPLEVEEVAKRFDGVDDCICKGRPDELIGAVPVLYIVADQNLEIPKLEQHLINWLEDFKRPRSVKRIEQVPRTYNGKLDRKTNID